MTAPQPVGIGEIAERLQVERNTVQVWRVRKILPPAWVELSGGPVWRWSTIKQWARDTGRLPEQRAARAAAQSA